MTAPEPEPRPTAGYFTPSWTGSGNETPVGMWWRDAATVNFTIWFEPARDPYRTTAYVGESVRELELPAG